ncbi:hypothetical protein LTR97_011308 [Elasticomyces elasticus]|uniref:Uncharacterized protein n=1 Tax=Elasticomyces elasticus TaxID=574655 RepID=A0AAN7VN34_9PEZI|nr:hypothetical protein LTR97_011308 [Elasticomyces elasticus]
MARPGPGAGPPGQPPVSFKLVPGRQRTQKWQQAKAVDYGGDDYDFYDEYADEPAPAPPMPPYAQQRPQRQNSFDAGDDGTRRQGSGQYERRGSPVVGRPSGDYARGPPPGSRGSNDSYAGRRNFTNPEQVPLPLKTNSPSPVRTPAPVGGSAQFPPRKSSVGSVGSSIRSPAGDSANTPPVPAAKALDKPLPFIRPSDIYRRMQEERERESASPIAGRDSMDSTSRAVADTGSPTASSAGGMGGLRDSPAFSPASDRRPSLEPVAERRELEATRHMPAATSPTFAAQSNSRPGTSNFAAPSPAPADMQQQPQYAPLSSLSQPNNINNSQTSSTTRASPVLPPVTRFSGFGSDFMSSSNALTPTTSLGSGDGHVQSTILRVLGAPIVNTDGAADTAASTPYSPVHTSASPFNAPQPQQVSDLQHQPSTASTGFRSVVHTAFDHESSSQAGSDGLMSRSNTTSTAGISPIMSQVPSSQLSRDPPPPIMEETQRTPTQSRQASGDYPVAQQPNMIARKPSPSRNTTPSHSRNVSSELASVQPGYRRSLDPPSNGSSPARTPGMEDSRVDKRLSAPLVADMGHAETPGVLDQAAEVPEAHLEPVETPAVERSDLEPVLTGTTTGKRSMNASPERAPYSPAVARPRSTHSTNASPERSSCSPAIARPLDYSSREADIAHVANSSSPDEASYSPAVADAENATQQHFLRTHNSSLASPGSPVSPSGFSRPVSPGIAAQSQGLGIARATTPAGMAAGGSGRESPATKGRVREIAEKYSSLDDASRRNSGASVISNKSSWSRFGGSEENLALKRKGTGGSASLLAGDGAGDESENDELARSRDPPMQVGGLGVPAGLSARPGTESAMSFRPHLPGEWVSFAGTPATEQPPALARSEHDDRAKRDGSSSPLTTPRASQIAAQEDEEPVDLTPTRRDTRGFEREYKPLPLHPHSNNDARAQPEDSDNESVDFSPTTKKTQLEGRDLSQDHISSAMTQQVKDIGSALGASLMSIGGLATTARDFGSKEPAPAVKQPEMEAKVPYGYVSSLTRPVVPREESEMSIMTEAPVSVASEAPPTPPAKDGQEVESRDEDRLAPSKNGGGRPISSYFSGAVPPLRMGGHSREASAEPEQRQERPTVLPTMSTDTGVEDMESDRLRKEIVRSLEPAKREQMKRESIMEVQDDDVARTQDALDAPVNARRIEHGEKVLPAVEATPSTPRGKALPMMLDQRFSWENRTPEKQTLGSPPRILEPPAPEVAPEAPYERPHSRNLHIMNANVSDSESEEEQQPKVSESHRAPTETLPVAAPSGSMGLSPLVSPITKSQEDLTTMHERTQDGRLRDLSPSPVQDDGAALRQESTASSSEARIPSYYQKSGDVPDYLGMTPSASTTAERHPDVTVAPAIDSPTTAAAKRTSQSRVPPFREILAIKSSPDRIKTYDETRQTFAEMDTGLHSWLSAMMAQHPEHADTINSTPSFPGGLRATSGTFKHRHSPSIIKFTKQFANASGSTSTPSDAAIRKASVGMGGEGYDAVPKTPSKSRTGLQGEVPIDVEKYQQKGKEIMKSVGGGAKGLFQRGKSRFGRGADKASIPPSKPSSAASTPPPPSRSPYPPPAASSASSLRLTAAGASSSQSSTPPAPRSQLSRTPSSRPLSQTFARLRDRSRSKSTTRSRSRPGSLVITNPDLLLDSDDERLFKAAAEANNIATTSSTSARKETWAGAEVESGDERMQFGSAARSGTPSRLGVLPSPGAETFASVISFSPTKKQSNAGEESVEESIGAMERNIQDQAIPEEPTQAVSSHGSENTPRDLRPRSQHESTLVVTSAPVSTAPATIRPVHERKVSALASLPSQRARGISTPVSPPPQFTESKTPDDDDLYDRTPVATDQRSPWSGAFRASPNSLAQAGTSTPNAPNESTYAKHFDPEPRSTAYDTDDRRSEVSAQGMTGRAEGNNVSDDGIDSASRRSSISSLGRPDTVIAKRVSRILRHKSSVASESLREQAGTPVPALPNEANTAREGEQPISQPSTQIPWRPDEASGDSQAFMSRPYHGRIALPDRTLSYMPLGKDGDGMPVQDTLGTGVGESTPSVDLSGFSGPPMGTPPFQQHPLLRNSGYVQPTEYDKLRSSPIGTLTPTTQHSRQVSGDNSRRSSKRYSGFFRGPEVPAEVAAGVPTPNAMTPNYGLEDLDTTGAEAMLRSEPQEKRNKRRSGIWDAFKRSPSVSKSQFSRDSSVVALGAQSMQTPYAMDRAEDPSRIRTLKKPQRAASAATPPIQQPESAKKKRFSGLGLLFGRSSTQGRNTPNPKKLTKTQPPSDESPVRPPTTSRSVGHGYDAFETSRRQQIPDLQQRSTSQPWSASAAVPPNQYTPIDPDAPFANIPRSTSQRIASPPPQTYQESMSTIDYTARSPPLVPIQPAGSRPGYRTLHSASFQRGLQQASIPEAFRPVEASYSRHVAPVGPPSEHQSPTMYRPAQSPPQPTLPTQQAYWSGGAPLPESRQSYVEQRQLRDLPVLQDGGRPEHQSWGQRIDTSVTPERTTSAGSYPSPHTSPVRDHRVSSLNQEMARSPAQGYTEQQTPWAINVPRPGYDARQSSRPPSWVQPRPQANSAEYREGQYTSQPPANYDQRYTPMSAQSPDSNMPSEHRRPEQSRGQTQAAMYPDLYAREPTGLQASRYPSPPYTPQSPLANQGYQPGYAPSPQQVTGAYDQSHYGPPAAPYYPAYDERYIPEQQQPPQQQQRYYAPQQYTQAPPKGPTYPQARPLTYQRTPSGYTGRRDDATVSEQELMGMSPTTFPGQEWSPRG